MRLSHSDDQTNNPSGHIVGSGKEVPKPGHDQDLVLGGSGEISEKPIELSALQAQQREAQMRMSAELGRRRVGAAFAAANNALPIPRGRPDPTAEEAFSPFSLNPKKYRGRLVLRAEDMNRWLERPGGHDCQAYCLNPAEELKHYLDQIRFNGRGFRLMVSGQDANSIGIIEGPRQIDHYELFLQIDPQRLDEEGVMVEGSRIKARDRKYDPKVSHSGYLVITLPFYSGEDLDVRGKAKEVYEAVRNYLNSGRPLLGLNAYMESAIEPLRRRPSRRSAA